MDPFEPSHATLRADIELCLDEVLRKYAANLPDAGPLVAEIARMIDAGGKRLRPAFCYWGFRASGAGPGEEIVSAAASLELLHTFAIVHDDIMDSATHRRGVPSVSAQHGTEVALLVGDLALVLADDLFMHSGFAPEVVARGFGCYSRMRQEVIAGQFLDIQAGRTSHIEVAAARRIAVLKSGRYSVEEPLAIGAVLGGTDDSLLARLTRVAAPLGEAFQLRDDLLGTFGRSVETGKSNESDIRQGKRNILFALALERSSGSDRATLEGRWGAPDLEPDEVARLRSVLEASGARAGAEALLADLSRDVRTALEDLPVHDHVRSALADLAKLAIERDH